MNLFNLFKNLNLGIKVNIVVILVFIILLTLVMAVLRSSVQALTRQTGRQQIEQETKVIQKRFMEAEQTLLQDIKSLAATPGLIEAVANKDVDAVQLLVLVGGAPFDFNDIDIMDVEKTHFEREPLGNLSHIEDEETLISLALLRIEITGIISEKKEAEVEFSLAAAIPLINSAGTVIGALLVDRKIDTEFLKIINLSRKNIDLILIHEGQILAGITKEKEYLSTSLTAEAILLDQSSIRQALNGQTVIAADLVSLNGVLHALVHTPLSVGGHTEGVLAILINMDELVSFQKQVMTNTSLIFLILALTAVFIVTLLMQQSINIPINKLQLATQQMMAGDYTQRAEVTSRDEIGRLAQAFNKMGSQLHQLLATLEQRVEVRTAELEAANQELQHFTYIVSHDLRAPLVNLKGFATELHFSLEDILGVIDPVLPHLNQAQKQTLTLALYEDAPEALKFIDASVSRMDHLIDTLLQLSRLGHREFNFEALDMNALVQETLQSLAHQIEQGQVEVTNGALPQVVADRIAMEQIMGNILANAVAYLDPERPGKIEISAEYNHNASTFHIRDNGRGIAAQDMDKVFAPFRRAGQQNVPGEGMGLAYVQALIRRHEGRIWCQSEVGVGTTFSFSLPDE